MTMAHRAGTWLIGAMLVVGVVSVASAQEQTVATTSQTAKPAGGMSEGIKVHGRWTVVVRNPDGSVASKHEFNNALSGRGHEVLAGLLGRGYRGVSQWEIRLNSSEGSCTGAAPGCTLPEFLGSGALPDNSINVFLPELKGRFGDSLLLSGRARFGIGGAISSVNTGLALCLDPACSAATERLQFTSHTLATPIEVAQGQLVEVRVIVSFS